MTTAKDFARFAPALQESGSGKSGVLSKRAVAPARLREITVPLWDNNGRSYINAVAKFEAEASQIAGGITRYHDVTGRWTDPDTLQEYRDHVNVFRVGCSDEQFGRIVALAFDLFPDQQTIFTADVGTFDLIERLPKQSEAE